MSILTEKCAINAALLKGASERGRGRGVEGDTTQTVALTEKGSRAVRRFDLLDAAQKAKTLAASLAGRDPSKSERAARLLHRDLLELERQLFCLTRVLSTHLREEASRDD